MIGIRFLNLYSISLIKITFRGCGKSPQAIFSIVSLRSYSFSSIARISENRANITRNWIGFLSRTILVLEY